jgi:hypothetical protein
MSGPSVGSSTHGSGLEGGEATVIIERGNWYNRDNSIKDERRNVYSVWNEVGRVEKEPDLV